MRDLLTTLRVASGGPEVIPEGKAWCPECNTVYTPTYPSLSGCPQTDKVAKEQHISGTCSQICWDKLTEENNA